MGVSRKVLIARVVLTLALAGYGGQALAHWPDQAPHQIANLGEFRFEGGGVIPNLKMSYVTHGKLNAAKDNAILLCAAAARGGDDQIHAAEAHRAGDELAVLERAQERAKGVNQRTVQEAS